MMQHRLEQHHSSEENSLLLVALRLQLLDWLEAPEAGDPSQFAPSALTVSDWEGFAAKLQQFACNLSPTERQVMATLLRAVSAVPTASA